MSQSFGKAGNWIILLYSILIIATYAFNNYFNIPTLSSRTSDWADFATYLSGMVSPLIALYVLYYVVHSYSLQKKEFANAGETMRQQLEVDGLLRRQDSIINESNRLLELVLAKLSSIADLDDDNYKEWYQTGNLYNKAKFKKIDTVENCLDMSIAKKGRGDYNNELPKFPKNYNYLVNGIRSIDALCEEIKRIDNKLKTISNTFDTHISEAFVLSTSAQIEDLVRKLRKLGKFDKVNIDFLNNF